MVRKCALLVSLFFIIVVGNSGNALAEVGAQQSITPQDAFEVPCDPNRTDFFTLFFADGSQRCYAHDGTGGFVGVSSSGVVGYASGNNAGTIRFGALGNQTELFAHFEFDGWFTARFVLSISFIDVDMAGSRR